jgi:hypothetical protein
MNQPDNPQSLVEDLNVTQEQAEDVKAGAEIPFYLKLHGVDGDVTHLGEPVNGGWDLKENIKI